METLNYTFPHLRFLVICTGSTNIVSTISFEFLIIKLEGCRRCSFLSLFAKLLILNIQFVHWCHCILILLIEVNLPVNNKSLTVRSHIQMQSNHQSLVSHEYIVQWVFCTEHIICILFSDWNYLFFYFFGFNVFNCTG